ncbi:hypothetical protein PM085_19440, partial [Halorubrum ezzemoulense]
IAYVREENWRTDDEGEPIDHERFSPTDAANFDDQTLIHLEPSQDGTISGLSLTINKDPAALRAFMIERNIKDNWKESVERHYELAMVFYTITMYRSYIDENEADSSFDLDDTGLLPADVVARSINALAPTIMPTIISDDQLERISE